VALAAGLLLPVALGVLQVNVVGSDLLQAAVWLSAIAGWGAAATAWRRAA
jgi:hypothetical protein